MRLRLPHDREVKGLRFYAVRPQMKGFARERPARVLTVRSMSRRIILTAMLTLVITAEVEAQSSNQDASISALQRQLEEMRLQMARMQNRIADLEVAKGIAATTSSADLVLPQSQTPPAQSLSSQHDEPRKSEGLTSFHYRRLTLTQGGFLEASLLVRTRNENADIANNFSAI